MELNEMEIEDINVIQESIVNKPLKFYHLISKDVKLDEYGLKTPEYVFNVEHNETLYLQMVNKYRDRLCNGWDIYPGRKPSSLTAQEIYDGINKFREDPDGNNQIYMFRFPPFKELGPNMEKILETKDIYEIDIDDPNTAKYIKMINWGYRDSYTGNEKLIRAWYENITKEDYFAKYDDNSKPLFATLNHISIDPTMGYLPLSVLRKYNPEEDIVSESSMLVSNDEMFIQESKQKRDKVLNKLNYDEKTKTIDTRVKDAKTGKNIRIKLLIENSKESVYIDLDDSINETDFYSFINKSKIVIKPSFLNMNNNSAIGMIFHEIGHFVDIIESRFKDHLTNEEQTTIQKLRNYVNTNLNKNGLSKHDENEIEHVADGFGATKTSYHTMNKTISKLTKKNKNDIYSKYKDIIKSYGEIQNKIKALKLPPKHEMEDKLTELNQKLNHLEFPDDFWNDDFDDEVDFIKNFKEIENLKHEIKTLEDKYTLYIKNENNEKKIKETYPNDVMHKRRGVLERSKMTRNSSDYVQKPSQIKTESSNVLVSNEEFFEESNHEHELVKVTDFPFDKVYVGSDKDFGDDVIKMEKSELFVTPYIGIASIFTTDRSLYKIPRNRSINIGYDEWSSKDLSKPFKEIHVVLEGAPEIEPFSFNTVGYIYEIDVKDLKDHLYRKSWMSKIREVLIRDVNEVKISKKIKWEHTCHVRGAERDDIPVTESSLLVSNDEMFIQESKQKEKDFFKRLNYDPKTKTIPIPGIKDALTGKEIRVKLNIGLTGNDETRNAYAYVDMYNDDNLTFEEYMKKVHVDISHAWINFRHNAAISTIYHELGHVVQSIFRCFPEHLTEKDLKMFKKLEKETANDMTKSDKYYQANEHDQEPNEYFADGFEALNVKSKQAIEKDLKKSYNQEIQKNYGKYKSTKKNLKKIENVKELSSEQLLSINDSIEELNKLKHEIYVKYLSFFSKKIDKSSKEYKDAKDLYDQIEKDLKQYNDLIGKSSKVKFKKTLAENKVEKAKDAINTHYSGLENRIRVANNVKDNEKMFKENSNILVSNEEFFEETYKPFDEYLKIHHFDPKTSTIDPSPRYQPGTPDSKQDARRPIALPKSKKEYNRINKFLRENEFDPKNETILTDITDDNGKRVRINFNIAQNLFGTSRSDYVKSSKNSDGAYANLNGLFPITGSSINIPASDLTRKPFSSNQIFKHEEGHIDDHISTMFNREHQKEIELIKYKARQFDEEEENVGNYKNLSNKDAHDRRPNEHYADYYGAIHNPYGDPRKNVKSDIDLSESKNKSKLIKKLDKDVDKSLVMVNIINELSYSKNLDKDIKKYGLKPAEEQKVRATVNQLRKAQYNYMKLEKDYNTKMEALDQRKDINNLEKKLDMLERKIKEMHDNNESAEEIEKMRKKISNIQEKLDKIKGGITADFDSKTEEIEDHYSKDLTNLENNLKDKTKVKMSNQFLKKVITSPNKKAVDDAFKSRDEGKEGRQKFVKQMIDNPPTSSKDKNIKESVNIMDKNNMNVLMSNDEFFQEMDDKKSFFGFGNKAKRNASILDKFFSEFNFTPSETLKNDILNEHSYLFKKPYGLQYYFYNITSINNMVRHLRYDKNEISQIKSDIIKYKEFNPKLPDILCPIGSIMMVRDFNELLNERKKFGDDPYTDYFHEQLWKFVDIFIDENENVYTTIKDLSGKKLDKTASSVKEFMDNFKTYTVNVPTGKFTVKTLDSNKNDLECVIENPTKVLLPVFNSICLWMCLYNDPLRSVYGAQDEVVDIIIDDDLNEFGIDKYDFNDIMWRGVVINNKCNLIKKTYKNPKTIKIDSYGYPIIPIDYEIKMYDGDIITIQTENGKVINLNNTSSQAKNIKESVNIMDKNMNVLMSNEEFFEETYKPFDEYLKIHHFDPETSTIDPSPRYQPNTPMSKQRSRRPIALPKSKKEYNRINKFLRENDFDPKNETILSDIIDPDTGKRRRINFNIAQNLFGTSDDDRPDKSKKTPKGPYASLHNLNPVERTSINLPVSDLTKKPFSSNQSFKHEEGHVDDHLSMFNKEHQKEIELIKYKARQFDEEEENAGNYKYLTDKEAHDRLDNEHYADYYGAMHNPYGDSRKNVKSDLDYTENGFKSKDIKKRNKSIDKYDMFSLIKELSHSENIDKDIKKLGLKPEEEQKFRSVINQMRDHNNAIKNLKKDKDAKIEALNQREDINKLIKELNALDRQLDELHLKNESPTEVLDKYYDIQEKLDELRDPEEDAIDNEYFSKKKELRNRIKKDIANLENELGHKTKVKMSNQHLKNAISANKKGVNDFYKSFDEGTAGRQKFVNYMIDNHPTNPSNESSKAKNIKEMFELGIITEQERINLLNRIFLN